MADIHIRVGGRIRELRRDLGLTQEQLGERAGLSYKFIGEIERGVGNPTLGTLEALATALEMDITGLLSAEPSRAPYATLNPTDFATVREARDSLDQMLSLFRDKRKGRPRTTRR